MTITTDEDWEIDGVSLQTLMWNVRSWGGSLQGTPPMRGEDVEIPGRPGRVWVPKTPDSRTLVFEGWVIGADVDGHAQDQQAFRQNWRALRALFYGSDRQVEITKKWRDAEGVLQQAVGHGQVLDPVLPESTGPRRAEFSVAVFMADPFFYGEEESVTLDMANATVATSGPWSGLPVVEETLDVLGDDYTGAIDVTINGPTENAKVVTGDRWVGITGEIPAYESASVDTDDYEARYYDAEWVYDHTDRNEVTHARPKASVATNAPLPKMVTWDTARQTGRAQVIAIGDSITMGGSASSMTKRWQTLLQERLRGGAVGATYPFLPGYAANAAWGIGRAGNVTQNTGLGLSWYTAVLNDDTSVVTFLFTGDRVVLMYGRGPTYGIMSVTIDGGTPVLVDTSGTASTAVIWTSPVLADGPHTVTVRRSSTSPAGSVIQLQGALTYRGDYSNGIRVLDAGHSGFSSSHMTEANRASAMAGAMLAAGPASGGVLPTLAIIGFGTNDYVSGVTPAAFKTNIEATITALRDRGFVGSVLLLGMYLAQGRDAATWQQYHDQLAAIAAADSMVEYLDLREYMPPIPTPYDAPSGLGYYADALHPSDAGHERIAQVIYEVMIARRTIAAWNIGGNTYATLVTDDGEPAIEVRTTAPVQGYVYAGAVNPPAPSDLKWVALGIDVKPLTPAAAISMRLLLRTQSASANLDSLYATIPGPVGEWTRHVHALQAVIPGTIRVNGFVWPSAQLGPAANYRARRSVIAYADTEAAARALVADFYDGDTPNTEQYEYAYVGASGASASTRRVNVPVPVEEPGLGRVAHAGGAPWLRIGPGSPTVAMVADEASGTAEVRYRPVYL